MTPYVAFLWDSRRVASSRYVAQLQQRLQASGMDWISIWASGGVVVFARAAAHGTIDTYPLPQRAGVIVGSIYRRHSSDHDDSAHAIATFDADTALSLLEHDGRPLIEQYWGNYVAILRSTIGEGFWLLKDPTGALPCYITTHAQITIAFAAASDIEPLQLPLTLNAEYLQVRMVRGMAPQPQPALTQVSRLHGGECLKLIRTDDGFRTQRLLLWHPNHFLRNRIEDADTAAQALRAQLRACTRTLARSYGRVLLRLSGGLDSSIIHRCLAASEPDYLLSYTYFDPDGASDERPWARSVARTAGEHLELALDPSTMDLSILDHHPLTIEPAPAMSFFQRVAIEAPLGSAHRALGVFSGDGGDSGFGSFVAAHAAADYLKHHGPTSTFWRTAHAVALLSHRTVWTIAAKSVGDVIRTRTLPATLATDLVSPDLLDEAHTRTRAAHPWLDSRYATALQMRLGQLLLPPMHAPLRTAQVVCPDVLTPIYAQPVIELLLRTPSYVLFDGGRDRGLARRAFACDVPPSIIERRWKDRAPHFFERLIASNRAWLRQTLLEGVLIKEGLLRKDMTERELAESIDSRVSPTEVFRHLDTELWVRRWQQS